MAGAPTIADDIKRFILTSIPSVPYLEAMLLMRNEPAQPWDCTRLARRLYLPEKTALALLSELHASGIILPEMGNQADFRFSPGSDALRRMIDRLADTYAAHLVDVTHLIHSKTGKKAQHFADAFKWRKDS